MSTRGLDNAGKTTIVKRLLNEDIGEVSPTLGFIIRTIDYEGFVSMGGCEEPASSSADRHTGTS